MILGARIGENSSVKSGIKRAFDLCLATFALAVLSPLLVCLAVLVRLRLGSPVFFRQRRIGLGSRPFSICKFRTLSETRDSLGNLLPDAERLTAFGSLLRSTSLDELPELWNVIRGEMSLVGPRPLLEEYLPLYSEKQARRHEVRPGITGWAQINGRNAVTWEKRFELDVWYVDHHSLLLDLKILFATLAQAARRTGISEPGQATMSRFTGNRSPENQVFDGHKPRLSEPVFHPEVKQTGENRERETPYEGAIVQAQAIEHDAARQEER